MERSEATPGGGVHEQKNNLQRQKFGIGIVLQRDLPNFINGAFLQIRAQLRPSRAAAMAAFGNRKGKKKTSN